MRLRGGALLVSISIAMIIAILSGLLILLAAHYKQQESGVKLYKKLTLNSESAITLLLSDYKLAPGEKKTLDLYGEESDSVMLEKRAWGTYETLTARAFSGNKKVGQSVLCGYKTSAAERVALYMPDLGRPLNLCGKTRIRGTAFLPEAGPRRSFIDGRGYEGTVLVDGETKKSESALPELNKEILEQLSLLNKRLTSGNVQYTAPADTLLNSFEDPTIFIQGGMNLYINQKYWKGNIVVRADSMIVVDRSTRLEDIILIAPVIIVEDFTTASFQAFATDSLVVKKGVKLTYPSTLGLIKNRSTRFNPYITIQENSQLQGFVFSYILPGIEQGLYDQITVKLDNKSRLEGEVYASGYLEIKGEVFGSAYCNKFMLHTSAGTYENHLMDATLDARRIPEAFVSSGMLRSNDHKKVVKRLY